MPLPVEHNGIGLVCYPGFLDDKVTALTKRKKGILLLILVGLANLPDLDFLPGVFIEQPNYYHHGPSHSIFLALITALAVYAITNKYFNELDNKKCSLMLIVTAISHTLLDYFSRDTGHPYGVPLLWPLDNTYHVSTVSLFSDVERSGEPGMAFILSFFNTHNLIAIAGKLLFVALVSSMVVSIRYRHTLVKKNVISGRLYSLLVLQA